MKKFLFSFMLIAGLLTLSGCGQKEDENALVILNYGKYIEPDVIQQFEKKPVLPSNTKNTKVRRKCIPNTKRVPSNTI